MSEPIISPAFHRLPEQVAIIGRMVLGYSDLELIFALIMSLAIDANQDDIFRALFGARSEGVRISLIDALAKQPMDKLKLDGDFATAKGAIKHCMKIRNQYAHCQWADTNGVLFFADLDESAAGHAGFKIEYRHIDLALLKQQESYFAHSRDFLLYLEHEVKLRKMMVNARLWTKRPSMPLQPSLYNPQVQYPRPTGSDSSTPGE